jgi:predicted helicase
MSKTSISLQLIQQYYSKVEQIIDLLLRGTTVSMETMRIVKEMP